MATGSFHREIPLLVLEEDGSLHRVDIPRMSASAFEFFKKMLDVYRPAIVIAEKPTDEGGKSNVEPGE